MNRYRKMTALLLAAGMIVLALPLQAQNTTEGIQELARGQLRHRKLANGLPNGCSRFHIPISAGRALHPSLPILKLPPGMEP